VTERTFFMVKPDAMRARVLGNILSMIEASGLALVAARIRHLRVDEAQRFYAVHKERPFFGDLVKFMTSGPVFIGVLEGEDAVKRWRDLMGPTDSKKAPKGTVRGEFGTDVEQNASHGSDAPETARAEIAFFFPGVELPGATAAPGVAA
jgi:nucleoside-diphosphate kinase